MGEVRGWFGSVGEGFFFILLKNLFIWIGRRFGGVKKLSKTFRFFVSVSTNLNCVRALFFANLWLFFRRVFF